MFLWECRKLHTHIEPKLYLCVSSIFAWRIIVLYKYLFGNFHNLYTHIQSNYELIFWFRILYFVFLFGFLMLGFGFCILDFGCLDFVFCIFVFLDFFVFSILGFCILDFGFFLYFGVWILYFGFWILYFGFLDFWIWDFGLCSLDFGCWILYSGLWNLYVGFLDVMFWIVDFFLFWIL